MISNEAVQAQVYDIQRIRTADSPRLSKPEVSVPGVSPSQAPLAIPPDDALPVPVVLATLVATAAAEDVTSRALLALLQTELLPQAHPASCLLRLSHPLEGSAPSVGADDPDADSAGQLHCAADVIEVTGAEAVVHGMSVETDAAEEEAEAVQAHVLSSLLARLRFASDPAEVVASHPDGGVSPSQSELDDVAAAAADEVVGQAQVLVSMLTLLLLIMVLTAFAELVDGCSDGAAEEVAAAAAEDVATTVAPHGVVVVAVAHTVEVLYADEAYV